MEQKSHSSQPFMLRSGITITADQYQQINHILNELAQSAPAYFILLADVTGQVVLALGASKQFNLTALGSLIAGDLAASQEIARLTGEYQERQLILREGQSRHSLLLSAGSHLALWMQINKEVPLGWARLLIHKTARQLANIVVPSAPRITEEDTKRLLEENIPELFDDALNDLWTE